MPDSTSRRRRSSGQALPEFALVLPVLMALIGGIIQFGLIFWAQNTLTQVVRDTGRWAATQQTSPCSAGAAALGTEANAIAATSSLLGYTTGQWGAPTVEGSDAQVESFSASEGIAVAWVNDSGTESCPPQDNQTVWHVSIKIDHVVPIFLPGLQYLPGLGTCDSTGCHITLSSTAQFRMEPAPAP